MKILILKPSSLGDVVHALPVLRLLRLNFPDSEIYWWIDKRFSQILENDKDLNGIIIFDRNNWRNLSFLKTFTSNLISVRNQKFDLVIDLQGLLRSGLFGWFASGAMYIGVDQSREGASAFYDVAIQRPSPNTHAIDWYLEILKYLKLPIHFNFTWLPEDKTAQDSISRKWGLNSLKYIVICPGARWKTKQLPSEYFIELVKQLANREKSLNFVIIGGKDCYETGEKIHSIVGNRCVNTATQTTIREMIEIIRFSEFFISNDTGPLHIAAALKKPLIAFFGPTEPRKTGPYGFPSGAIQVNLPCVPCFRRKCHNPIEIECLKRLVPEIILKKFYEIQSKSIVYQYPSSM